MTSVSTEPPTLRSIPFISSADTTASQQRRSYSCYNCNYSFHIVPTAATSPSSPSSFRCPGCHHRHLIPYYTISLPLPPLAPAVVPTRIVDYVPAPSNFVYQSSDESDDDDDGDDYDSDNSLLSLTTPDFYPSTPTPAAKSIVGSLPIKIFSANSTAPLQSCSICMEDFVVNSGTSVAVNELPCGHYFHKDCIVEWLQRSNSCPLCRYKLPVDPVPQERIDPPTTHWDGEYDAVLVVDLTRPRVNREESVNSEANAAASGSDIGGLSANGGEISNWNVDAMRDEDGDTLMIDA